MIQTQICTLQFYKSPLEGIPENEKGKKKKLAQKDKRGTGRKKRKRQGKAIKDKDIVGERETAVNKHEQNQLTDILAESVSVSL